MIELLKQPISIHQLNLRNRIVMPPMATGKADHGKPDDSLISYYAARAKETGLIIVEHEYVSPEGMAHGTQLSIADDSVIPALENLGVAPADARDYVPVGCYEPDAYGEVPCTCAGTVSMLKCVETALFDGRDPRTGEQIGPRTGEAADFEDFQAFLDAVPIQR